MSFKKSLFILGFAVSLGAQAGVYKCEKGDVSVPCKINAWTVGGDALYLQPNGAIENTIAVGTQSFNHDSDWGFRIEAGYLFGNGNDFNVNWAYFDQAQTFRDNNGNVYPIAGLFSSALKMSVVNLELGQYVDFGEKWGVRMHVGMQIDNLTSEISATQAGARTVDFLKFDMIGARAGFDTTYHLMGGLSFYTNGALGALHGNSTLSGPPNGAWANLNVPLQDNTINGGFVSIDYNIGLNYMSALSQGNLITRVGWVSYNWLSGDNGDLSTRALPAYNGLIFGARWVGNA